MLPPPITKASSPSEHLLSASSMEYTVSEPSYDFIRDICQYNIPPSGQWSFWKRVPRFFPHNDCLASGKPFKSLQIFRDMPQQFIVLPNPQSSETATIIDIIISRFIIYYIPRAVKRSPLLLPKCQGP